MVRKINVSNKTDTIKEISFRNFKHFDTIVFQEELFRQPWCTVDSLLNIGISVEEIIFRHTDKHAPTMTKRVTNKGCVPWMTREIRNKMINRDHFKKQAILTISLM